MSSEFLEPEDLRQLTGCRVREDQIRVLRRDGIPFKERGRRLLVSRHHAREWISGKVITPTRKPDFSHVR